VTQESSTTELYFTHIHTVLHCSLVWKLCRYAQAAEARAAGSPRREGPRTNISSWAHNAQYFEGLCNGLQPHFGTDGPVGEVGAQCIGVPHAHVLCGYRARQAVPSSSTVLSPHWQDCAPPVSPMQDGAAAALNAESCVSSRPHVTAGVTVAAGCQAAYAGTRRSHTHRSQPAAVRTRPSAGTRT
jgi:hypothetical protein